MVSRKEALEQLVGIFFCGKEVGEKPKKKTYSHRNTLSNTTKETKPQIIATHHQCQSKGHTLFVQRAHGEEKRPLKTACFAPIFFIFYEKTWPLKLIHMALFFKRPKSKTTPFGICMGVHHLTWMMHFAPLATYFFLIFLTINALSLFLTLNSYISLRFT